MPSPRRVPRGCGKELLRTYQPLPRPLLPPHPPCRCTPSAGKPLPPPAAVRLRPQPTRSRALVTVCSLAGDSAVRGRAIAPRRGHVVPRSGEGRFWEQCVRVFAADPQRFLLWFRAVLDSRPHVNQGKNNGAN